jgi:hypothetical protein
MATSSILLILKILSPVNIAPVIAISGLFRSPLPANYLNSSIVSGVYVKIMNALPNSVNPRQSSPSDNTT